MNTTQETIPAIGATITRRKFIAGVEKVGEITDTQVVKGYAGVGVALSDSMLDLTDPAIVCESGKVIPYDSFLFSWQ